MILPATPQLEGRKDFVMSDFQQVVLDRLPRNVNEGELGIACNIAAHAAAISLPGDAGSPPAETCWRSLAFDILRLKDELRALVIEVVWSPELMAAVLAEITRRGQFWTLAIVSLGNISATCDARFCLKHEGMWTFYRPHII